MFTSFIALALVATLYGLIWHDQPANEREEDRHDKPG